MRPNVLSLSAMIATPKTCKCKNKEYVKILKEGTVDLWHNYRNYDSVDLIIIVEDIEYKLQKIGKL